MQISYKMKDLGCAHCAAKMEKDIATLDGINSAQVNFLFSKISLDIEDELAENPQFLSELMQQAQAIVSKYEPDCRIAC